ncbi:MAG: twin-arginine translocase TatA/TatE family subunit [Nitrososphaerota archaeon]|nr:twin-arginine translocase TatA/TatE family subunit [Nitrososphaerota archaeon]MDG6922333.1 twin-arginine translocase TatA/TatE family subunit [Nitrososphaerota archaeon]
MAFDDPIVWVLIAALVIFLFGSNKIPQIARSIGQARREFETSWKGLSNELTATAGATSPQTFLAKPRPQLVVQQSANVAPSAQTQPVSAEDPLVVACKGEGIDTSGKTREQLASELSWKLNKK